MVCALLIVNMKYDDVFQLLCIPSKMILHVRLPVILVCVFSLSFSVALLALLVFLHLSFVLMPLRWFFQGNVCVMRLQACTPHMQTHTVAILLCTIYDVPIYNAHNLYSE